MSPQSDYIHEFIMDPVESLPELISSGFLSDLDSDQEPRANFLAHINAPDGASFDSWKGYDIVMCRAREGYQYLMDCTEAPEGFLQFFDALYGFVIDADEFDVTNDLALYGQPVVEVSEKGDVLEAQGVLDTIITGSNYTRWVAALPGEIFDILVDIRHHFPFRSCLYLDRSGDYDVVYQGQSNTDLALRGSTGLSRALRGYCRYTQAPVPDGVAPIDEKAVQELHLLLEYMTNSSSFATEQIEALRTLIAYNKENEC